MASTSERHLMPALDIIERRDPRYNDKKVTRSSDRAKPEDKVLSSTPSRPWWRK